MWVEQVEDAMVTGDARADKEYTHTTDEGIHIASSGPTIPDRHTDRHIIDRQTDKHEVMNREYTALTGDLDQGHE